MIVSGEAENCPFIVKMSSNETKMKEQCKVFPVDKKMQILAKVNSHVGTRVDLAAMFGLSVLTLNTIASQRSEIESTYLCSGPSFSKECQSLKTSPLEKLETIPLAWLKQVRTANTSISGPRLKEKALHVAAHLGIDSFLRKDNLVYKTVGRKCHCKS
jgi:hypothetical protein